MKDFPFLFFFFSFPLPGTRSDPFGLPERVPALSLQSLRASGARPRSFLNGIKLSRWLDKKDFFPMMAENVI
jgi:hypothetical protein